MSLAVVLAVGVNSSLLTNQRLGLQSAGCYLIPARSIRDALTQLKEGEFDLIVMGCSLSPESRERLTFLIRSSGSRIPVICMTESGHDSFADATIRNEPDHLLQVIGELLANRIKTSAVAQPYKVG